MIDIKIKIEPVTSVYWRILHNPEVPVDPPRPDVVVCADDEKNNNVSFVPMTEAIQRLSYDLFCHGVGENVLLFDRPKKWRMLYSENLAFTNTAGYDGKSPRRDYINRLDMTAELPILQKAITIAGHIARGREVNGFVEFETLSPANVPTLDWLLANPHLYFEAMNVNKFGQSRFPQGNTAPVLVPWFCADGKIARLPLSAVERL
jgi:hypothetical protein